MLELRYATAATIKIGPFVDNTDYYTLETALTISQSDVLLCKNGGGLAQKHSSATCVHDLNGVYYCYFDTTDTGTLGALRTYIFESGCLPVSHEFSVIAQNFWDSKYSSDRLQVHTAEITNDLITSSTLA